MLFVLDLALFHYAHNSFYTCIVLWRIFIAFYRQGSSCQNYKLTQEVMKKIDPLRAYKSTKKQTRTSKDEATLYSRGNWCLGVVRLTGLKIFIYIICCLDL